MLGILPGPNEVSLHKINHYLALIVDELESLWDGITLNQTYECIEGKEIRAALILVSCNIPAARKYVIIFQLWWHIIYVKRKQIIRIVSIISLEWIIWINGFLHVIQMSIVKMRLVGDNAIQKHHESDG